MPFKFRITESSCMMLESVIIEIFFMCGIGGRILMQTIRMIGIHLR